MDAVKEIAPRYVKTTDLVKYLGIGRNSALKFGEDAGAKRYLTNKLIVWDLNKIDNAIEARTQNI